MWLQCNLQSFTHSPQKVKTRWNQVWLWSVWLQSNTKSFTQNSQRVTTSRNKVWLWSVWFQNIIQTFSATAQKVKAWNKMKLTMRITCLATSKIVKSVDAKQWSPWIWTCKQIEIYGLNQCTNQPSPKADQKNRIPPTSFCSIFLTPSKKLKTNNSTFCEIRTKALKCDAGPKKDTLLLKMSLI